ncbi:class I adenylate-forming enzyme family protein [Leucobacter sp. NPDC015123]|uniref:class I adenylate-forming enzyme family protein n=1 Tax=Leucobacter sp. NPDC015123 TaxID=3364129 RepID=UPI0036F47D86
MNTLAGGLHEQSRVDDFVSRGWWTSETIDGLFWRQVEERSAELAVVDPLNRVSLDGEAPRRLTWGEVGAEVAWLAARFLEHGVQSGDVIGMQLPNSIEQLEVYLAAWTIGAIVSPLAMQYREFEVTNAANDAAFDAYVCGDSFGDRRMAEEISQLREAVPSLRVVFSIGRAEVPAIPGIVRLAPQPADADEAVAIEGFRASRPNDPNECVTICWTSGTEGQPKGVMRAHYDWLSFSWAVIDALKAAGSRDQGGAGELQELGADDVLLNPFPLINMAGVCGFLLPWLRTGCVLVQHHPFDGPTFFAQVATERVTCTILPPALLWMLLNNDELLAKVDLSSLTRIGSGSAPLQPAMVRGWQERFGLRVINFFGSNEGVSLLSSGEDFPDPDERANYFPRYGAEGTTWASRVSTWVHHKLVDLETGQVITESGRPGELHISGPQLFGRYVKADSLANPFDEEGYLKTGDVFEIAGERNQFLRYVDRAKDLIIRGGMNIAPASLEQLITEHPAVLEVAVVGDPDEMLGERVAAIVVLRPGAELSLDELVEFLRARKIASFKLPERLAVIDALPRNPVGKVLKRELRLAAV